jgi:hypothetical protein
MKTFTTVVERFAGTGTWTFANIPFNCVSEFGKKGRIKVIGMLNGHDIQSTLMPHGDGRHFIILTKEIVKKSGIEIGDTISLSLEQDNAPQEIETPKEFLELLTHNQEAGAYYHKLPPSHKKEYLNYIEDAKKEETRQRRMGKAIEMLQQGKKLK